MINIQEEKVVNFKAESIARTNDTLHYDEAIYMIDDDEDSECGCYLLNKKQKEKIKEVDGLELMRIEDEHVHILFPQFLRF